MGFNSRFKGLNLKKLHVCVCVCARVYVRVSVRVRVRVRVRACVRVRVCVSLNELGLQRQLLLMLRRTIGRHGHPIFQFRIPPSAF